MERSDDRGGSQWRFQCAFDVGIPSQEKLVEIEDLRGLVYTVCGCQKE
jgi:hypothetical protein